MKRVGLLLLIVVGSVVAYIVAERVWRQATNTNNQIVVDVSAGAAAVRGTLFISVYGEVGNQPNPLKHRTVYVNGPDYGGMEDTDLRGFLDGHFKYDWNQSTQIHVRMGRRSSAPALGELELFRILHRWDEIELPPAAKVVNAQLEFMVEYGPSFPVDVYLYEVKKDWNPGKGGVKQNNNSPRAPSEVWWRDAAYGEKPWGLPGVGFASDIHADADTGAMPLAAVRYNPGGSSLQFSSPELVRYIGERVSAHQPLLFLLKLSDIHEDSPGTGLGLHSGNHGDIRNPKWRPHLSIEWESPAEIRRLEKRVFLEHGRSYMLTPLDIDGAQFISASFQSVIGFEKPIIEFRNGGHDEEREWRRMSFPIAVDGELLEMRLRAGQDLVILGEAFESELRDTWVKTAAPEEQVVPWMFESPTGRQHADNAVYQGDHRWTVRFVPNELGRWHYWWRQSFTDEPYKSAVGVFDVVGGDNENIRMQILTLRDEVQRSNLSRVDRQKAFGIAFTRLERAALQRQTPESFRSTSGQELQELLDELRTALSGINVPKSMLLLSDPPTQ